MSKIFGVWVATIAICIAVVKLTAIGPVIFVVSRQYGMGVHSFDLVTFIPVTLALVFTFRSFKKFRGVSVDN